mmetsp:Transcript_129496/g.375056  ORF Transcript_129496/g.375056 Transcript_129496/m.375056 type:complete len:182 (-) Transcript_129496:190-735(-)
MIHINKIKTSDGTGRDTYIVNDDLARYGKGCASQVPGFKPIGQWTLRDSAVPMSDAQGPVTKATPRACKPSNRRGGRGWLPTIHTDDSRRVDESLRVSAEREGRLAHAAGHVATTGAGRSPPGTERRLDNLMKRLASPRKAPSATASSFSPASTARGRSGRQFEQLQDVLERATPVYPDTR